MGDPGGAGSVAFMEVLHDGHSGWNPASSASHLSLRRALELAAHRSCSSFWFLSLPLKGSSLVELCDVSVRPAKHKLSFPPVSLTPFMLIGSFVGENFSHDSGQDETQRNMQMKTGSVSLQPFCFSDSRETRAKPPNCWFWLDWINRD